MLLKRDAAGDRGRALELVAAARQAADSLGLVRLQRKLDSLGVEGAKATAPGLIEGVAALETASAAKGATEPDEAGSIDAVAASAISRARDLSAQPSFEGTVTILFTDIEDFVIAVRKARRLARSRRRSHPQ